LFDRFDKISWCLENLCVNNVEPVPHPWQKLCSNPGIDVYTARLDPVSGLAPTLLTLLPNQSVRATPRGYVRESEGGSSTAFVSPFDAGFTQNAIPDRLPETIRVPNTHARYGEMPAPKKETLRYFLFLTLVSVLCLVLERRIFHHGQ
jgi:hypothetical protein